MSFRVIESFPSHIFKRKLMNARVNNKKKKATAETLSYTYLNCIFCVTSLSSILQKFMSESRQTNKLHDTKKFKNVMLIVVLPCFLTCN